MCILRTSSLHQECFVHFKTEPFRGRQAKAVCFVWKHLICCELKDQAVTSHHTSQNSHEKKNPWSSLEPHFVLSMNRCVLGLCRLVLLIHMMASSLVVFLLYLALRIHVPDDSASYHADVSVQNTVHGSTFFTLNCKQQFTSSESSSGAMLAQNMQITMARWPRLWHSVTKPCLVLVCSFT
jgi:hypothetical protein